MRSQCYQLEKYTEVLFLWTTEYQLKVRIVVFVDFSLSLDNSINKGWGSLGHHWPWLSLTPPWGSPHSPAPHFWPLGPSAPAPAVLQQSRSPAHHSPTLPSHGSPSARPTSGVSPSPGRCLTLRTGTAPVPPSCPAPVWGWDGSWGQALPWQNPRSQGDPRSSST